MVAAGPAGGVLGDRRGTCQAAVFGAAVTADADWHPSDLNWRLAVVGAGTGLLACPSFSLGPALATTTWAFSDYTLAGLRAAFALSAVTALTTLLVLRLRSAR